MGDEQRQEGAVAKMTATAAGVVAGVALLAAIIGISSNSFSVLAKIATSPPEEVSKSAPTVKAQPQQPPQLKREAAPISPAPRRQPPAVRGKSRIVIQAKQGSWIDACADGRTVIRRYLAPAGTAELGFANVAVVRTGNAGGVDISVNGRLAGPVGKIGEVRVIRFDAAGFHLLEQGDPGAECGQ
jgi:cytoskeleton protein RodZ